MSQDKTVSSGQADERPLSLIYDAIALGLCWRENNRQLEAIRFRTNEPEHHRHERKRLTAERHTIELKLLKTPAYSLEGLAAKAECLGRLRIGRLADNPSLNVLDRMQRSVMMTLLCMQWDALKPYLAAADAFDPVRFVKLSDRIGHRWMLQTRGDFDANERLTAEMVDGEILSPKLDKELLALQTAFNEGAKYSKALLRAHLIAEGRVILGDL